MFLRLYLCFVATIATAALNQNDSGCDKICLCSVAIATGAAAAAVSNLNYTPSCSEQGRPSPPPSNGRPLRCHTYNVYNTVNIYTSGCNTVDICTSGYNTVHIYTSGGRPSSPSCNCLRHSAATPPHVTPALEHWNTLCNTGTL